jgi:very-short-patch-repair endonuclease/DNA-directed RNA polymerase subunit RPC12/RpoP
MPHADALKDNIPFKNSGPGTNSYFIPCSECGKTLTSWSYHSGMVYRCKECRAKKLMQERADKSSMEFGKRLEMAIKFLEHQQQGVEMYQEAIEKIKKHENKCGWFQSSDEMLVALELIRSKTKARHQVKMGRFRADFVLPDLKVVLEVDGKPYHNSDTATRERVRDNCIIAALGPEWEVVRIDTEQIKVKLTKLVPAIKAVARGRKKLREAHGGRLPDNYTKKAI